jgi:hypothetical protein
MFTGDYRMNKEKLKGMIKQVILENRKKSVLLESPYLVEKEIRLSLDDVLLMLQDQNPRARLQRIGILTAENPRGESADESSNAKRMSDLRNTLDSKGLDYVELAGKYGGDETSYFILNIKKQDLIDLGKRYGQAAVIGGEKLIRNYRENQPSVYFRLTYYQTEPDGSDEPAFGPQEYYAVDDRDVVVSGKVAQAAPDLFSAIDGKKFQIPFFSDEPQHAMGDEKGAFAADRAWQPGDKEEQDVIRKNN